MNAVKFLLKEHNKVRNTFADISDESHREETKRKMFNALCEDLIRHETMEQKIWYPHLKNNEILADVIKHLISEEKSAAEAIKEFKTIKTEEEWIKKFVKLRNDVEHHAAEEEQKLFPKVEKMLDETKLEKIGKEMREFKSEYKEVS
ncbi:CBU_1677 family Dot/Icm type IV secretion system effector [soil metagenome]